MSLLLTSLTAVVLKIWLIQVTLRSNESSRTDSLKIVTSLTSGQNDSGQFKLAAPNGTPAAVLRLMTHYATRR